MSSSRDLSHYDVTLKRRPNWRRGVAHEVRPCCHESPMFAPSRSRCARVSIDSPEEAAGLLGT